MRILLLLLFCLSFLRGNCTGENDGYYFNTGGGFAPLLLGDLDSIPRIKKSWHFLDTLRVYPRQEEAEHGSLIPIPMKFNPTQPGDNLEPIGLQRFPFREINSLRKDSIVFKGKTYRIYTHHTDDGFVGGRPNHITNTLWVETLGIVHSSSNFFGEHDMILFRCRDSAKQELLTALLDRMENAFPRQFNYSFKKLLERGSSAAFDDLPQAWHTEWKSVQSHLRLLSAEYTDNITHVTMKARIKNVSDLNYFINSECYIGPALAMVHYGEKAHPWNLLETHYGTHFTRALKDIILKPGEEHEFSFTFRKHNGCGGCTNVVYSGFQLYPHESRFAKWLIGEPFEKNGVMVYMFPHREVKGER